MNVSFETTALLTAAIAVATAGQHCVSAEGGSTSASSTVLQADLEGEALGEAPPGWTMFTPGTQPAVVVASPGANGSGRCLRGTRTDYGALVALAKSFPSPQQRIEVVFSLALSRTAGRAFHVWTYEPDGKDASQLNLCVQGGKLQQYDGRTRTWEVVSAKVEPSVEETKPVWHRVRAVVDAKRPGIDFWLSEPGDTRLPEAPTATLHGYRTDMPLAGIAFVSGHRIAEGAWHLVDDLVVRGGEGLPAPGEVAPLPEPFELWTGLAIPSDPADLPFVEGLEHRTIHQATEDGYKFLHGAAIINHNGVFFSNWANSPTNENGPRETLQGRRSSDACRTWSDVEVIDPGFEGEERHSHGVLFEHKGELWTIYSRFGVGVPGRRFPGPESRGVRAR